MARVPECIIEAKRRALANADPSCAMKNTHVPGGVGEVREWTTPATTARQADVK